MYLGANHVRHVIQEQLNELIVYVDVTEFLPLELGRQVIAGDAVCSSASSRAADAFSIFCEVANLLSRKRRGIICRSFVIGPFAVICVLMLATEA